MTPQRERFFALDDDQRSRLLDPAEKEFADNGFENASLNRILEEADMSKGQAYYYIANKGDLYAHVFDRAFSSLVRSLQLNTTSIATADQFWQWVGRSFRSTSVFFMEHPRLAALGRTAYESGAALDALKASRQELQETFHSIVAHGQAVGAVRKDLPTDFVSSVLFAILREIDRWFALKSHTVAPSSLPKIEKKSVQLLKRAASDQ